MLPDDPEDRDPGLARERTRLAWVRTAIAFAAVGAVVLRREVIIGLIVLAAAPLIWGVSHLAGHRARPELLSRKLLLVTLAVTAVAVLAVIAALMGQSPGSIDQLLRRHG